MKAIGRLDAIDGLLPELPPSAYLEFEPASSGLKESEQLNLKALAAVSGLRLDKHFQHWRIPAGKNALSYDAGQAAGAYN